MKLKFITLVGKYGEGIYDGVEYYVTEKFHDLTCDVLVVSRYASGFDKKYNVKAKQKYLWVHDVYPYSLTKEIYDELDKILVLSNWHKDYVKQTYNFIQDNKIIITSNGIELERFTQFDNVPRDPYKVVMSSSPDRYLMSLLDMWKDIKSQVPKASLNLFYGFDTWQKTAEMNNDQNQLRLIKQMKDKIDSLKDYGVNYFGRTNQHNLAREMSTAGAWLYSTWFR